jgi:hypothetical protein
MSSNVALGVYLPADLTVPPRIVPIGGLDDIQVHVGGIIDAVTTVVDPAEYGYEGDTFSMVGYVHDEGLLLGMPLNERACVLFERHLVGDVVVVSGTNPTSGAYDGENYDVPDWYTERIMDGTLDWVIACASNMADRISEAFVLAVDDGLFDQHDIDRALKGMEIGRSNIHPDDAEIIDLIVMTCLAHHVEQTGRSMPNVDRRGLELLKQGLSDDMIAEFFRNEGGE